MAWIIVWGTLAEIGWLAVWPLSVALTQSAAFTRAYLDHEPLARAVLGSLAGAVRPIVPGLAEAPLAAVPGDGRFVGPAAALAGTFVWLAAVYLGGLVVLHRRARATPRAVAAVLVCSGVFQATLVAMPGLFSQDVFSYLAYGRLADAYGLNPYIWPPSAVDKDPLVAWVAEVWRTYACPYGPLWVDLQTRLTGWFGEWAPWQQALGYRLLSCGLLLASLGLLWRGLGRLAPVAQAPERLVALAALAWNPLLLLELVGSAHNDSLMVALSLLATIPLAVGRRDPLAAPAGASSARGVGPADGPSGAVVARGGFGLSDVLAGVCFTLGGLVKYLSGLGLVWVALAAAARARSWRTRLGRVAAVTLASAVVVVVLAAPWLELPDSLQPLVDETAGAAYVNSLPYALAMAVAERVVAAFGTPDVETRAAARLLEHLAVLGGFSLALAVEARRVWAAPTPRSVVRATAWSSLVYVLVVANSVQPWYYALPLALALLLGWRDRLARLAIGYSVLALPALYLAYYLREQTPGAIYAIYGLAPLLALLPPPSLLLDLRAPGLRLMARWSDPQREAPS